MIDKKLLATLVCPIDHSRLTVADNQLITRVNRAIAAGRMKTRGGQPIEQPIDGGLLRADKTLLYPVVDDIPVLLADEGIPLGQLD
jgi:uncharacterized protein YbaR (Trm112 family)